MSWFEYRYEIISPSQTSEEFTTWLNALGQHGWELVSASWQDQPSLVTNEFIPTKLIFKREREGLEEMVREMGRGDEM